MEIIKMHKKNKLGAIDAHIPWSTPLERQSFFKALDLSLDKLAVLLLPVVLLVLLVIVPALGRMELMDISLRSATDWISPALLVALSMIQSLFIMRAANLSRLLKKELDEPHSVGSHMTWVHRLAIAMIISLFYMLLSEGYSIDSLAIAAVLVVLIISIIISKKMMDSLTQKLSHARKTCEQWRENVGLCKDYLDEPSVTLEVWERSDKTLFEARDSAGQVK
jgi:hypothetical protein